MIVLIFTSISSDEKWGEIVEWTLNSLQNLISNNRQYGSGSDDISYIEKIIGTSNIRSLYDAKIGLAHEDHA